MTCNWPAKIVSQTLLVWMSHTLNMNHVHTYVWVFKTDIYCFILLLSDYSFPFLSICLCPRSLPFRYLTLKFSVFCWCSNSVQIKFKSTPLNIFYWLKKKADRSSNFVIAAQLILFLRSLCTNSSTLNSKYVELEIDLKDWYIVL
jgi:hypothetical protein